MQEYIVIGLMSGTSLDGLDVVACQFVSEEEQIVLQNVLAAETFVYESSVVQLLAQAKTLLAEEYVRLHVFLGHYMGKKVAQFIKKYNISADFVASHGQTVFHQPHIGLTSQIGDGASIAAECGLPVVCDFRSSDLAFGGQGAPLVPIGDAMLYADYDYCLNIGGICNISYQIDNYRIAFDISPANMALNYFAQKLGHTYDRDGILAKAGVLSISLFENLNQLDYYSQSYPKSLGAEWVENVFYPVIHSFDIDNKDILNTLNHHIAYQISQIVDKNSPKRMLITGGGAKNIYLCQLIKDYCKNISIVIPDEKQIDYKEAIIFALLGLLRWQNRPNCLASVTGAKKDVVGGAIYYC